ncbi:Uncharacterized protein Fot_09551 [Forsythia ovata]|uniref:Uncharacterized protein n=1 Tax=Forsythia ovata TaxID=205694 RepID=A0ABD1WEC4_9LAMI
MFLAEGEGCSGALWPGESKLNTDAAVRFETEKGRRRQPLRLKYSEFFHWQMQRFWPIEKGFVLLRNLVVLWMLSSTHFAQFRTYLTDFTFAPNANLIDVIACLLILPSHQMQS